MQLAEPSFLTLLSITGRHVLPNSGDSFFFLEGARPGTTCLTKVLEAFASNPGTCHRRFVAPPRHEFLWLYVLPHFQASPLSILASSNLWCIFSRYRAWTFRCRRFLSWKISCVRACLFTFTFCSGVNRKKIPFLKNIRL